ncbi:hypothetical protein EZV62_009287 [Acer yangbiense]|uniref:GBF-interacting protein 1 N-terminal domain-containing protein n=1 Tax=Acer yangbiense TaxID=1000413 RepID=A0A5C7IGS2_9ROSI|nr:hypothetical protein EZV62_009287 [Acer yangbiense]
MSTNINNRSGGGYDDDGGMSRVSIPAHIRPTIQTIRETTGKQHSDEEIYSVLLDCSMDPNETAQKLLYLDTFHEVKKKRDRKKEGQGARGGRGNYNSNYTPSVAGGGRNAARRENGVSHSVERGPVSRKIKNNAVPHGTRAFTAVPNGPSSLSNGHSSHGRDRQLAGDGIIPEPKDNTTVNAAKLGTVATQPAPTFASMVRVEQEKSVLSSNNLHTTSNLASVSGVYASASDPVLPPPVSQHPAAMGTIIHEVGSQPKAAESNHIQGNKDVSQDTDTESSKSEKTVSNTPKSIHKMKAESKSMEVENNQPSEPLQCSSESAHDSSLTIHSPKPDSQSPQESVAPPKVVYGVASITVTANSELLPESIVSDSQHQHVTFPNHFKVPEAVKNGLTFGSIDACFGLATKYVNDTSGEINPMCAIESSHVSDGTTEEPSPSTESKTSIARGETPDHLQSPPVMDNVPPTVSTISNGTDLKSDELELEMPLLPEGHQKIPVQSVPNYGFNFMLPSPGTQHVQVEGLETQTRDASLITNLINGNSLAPSSSPAPSMQSSVTAAPQPVHLFRQPYPSFLSYGHYLSPYFMPQMHQYLNPNGIPQQPSAGNVYLSSAAAAPGVKFPMPQFKPGTNAGNPPHIGIAPGYGPFSSSPVGFNPVTAGTSGKPTGNEDFIASQLKDNNHIYTTGPLNDGSGVWIPAPGQDLSNLQINPLYNLALQGQHITFAPAQTGHGAFPGIYQPAQTMTAPSNVNPLLQSPQTMATAVDTMGPPSGAYQQPQLAQMNWNPSY